MSAWLNLTCVECHRKWTFAYDPGTGEEIPRCDCGGKLEMWGDADLA